MSGASPPKRNPKKAERLSAERILERRSERTVLSSSVHTVGTTGTASSAAMPGAEERQTTVARSLPLPGQLTSRQEWREERLRNAGYPDDAPTVLGGDEFQSTIVLDRKAEIRGLTCRLRSKPHEKIIMFFCPRVRGKTSAKPSLHGKNSHGSKIVPPNSRRSQTKITPTPNKTAKEAREDGGCQDVVRTGGTVYLHPASVGD
ncbi:hypothetical protein Bbelb_087530 [Branchiostoma belcheri]|nr:hypothetical protein Bbelb_087530 [Branchiostoma belcheri]